MRIPVALLAAVCGVVPLSAAPQAPPETTIRTTSTEVVLELVVRDKRGKIVNNLKPSDIEIYEDGVRQELRSFRFLDPRERKPDRPGAQSRTAGNPRPLRAVNLVCVVFHNIPPVFRSRAIEAAHELLNRDFPAGTWAGMFHLDDRLIALHPFSSHPSELAKAAAGAFSATPVDFARASEAVFTANPNQVTIATTVDNVARTASTSVQVTGGEVSRTVVAGAEVANSPGANVQRGDRVTERRDFSNIQSMRETDKVITMITQLGALPGRKSVLLISGGLITGGDPERFESIVNRANQSGMSVYALDVAGLDENSTVQAGNNALGQVAAVSRGQTTAPRAGELGLGVAKERSRMGDTMNDAVRSSDTQAGLRALAEGTGGFLIANTNEFRKPFQRFAEEVDARYEALYRPTSPKYDGRLRNIEVKVARPGHTVESRTGYFAVPDVKGGREMQPFETMALAVLNAKPLPRGFEFATASFEFDKSRRALVFEIPGSALQPSFNRERQSYLAHLSLLAMVKDAAGQVVDMYSVDAPYEIPEANLESVRNSAVMFAHPVTLPPGKYTVETAVLDREGHRASTVVSAIESPRPPASVGMSSIVLIQRIEPVSGTPEPADPLIYQGKRLVPFIAATLPAEAKPYAYFVVYPDPSKSDKPKIRVEFLVGGQVVAEQTADLPAPDASGTIPMMVKAATRQGDCELRITAMQGGESLTRSVRYSVR